MTITVSIPYLILDRRLPLVQGTWSSLWWPIIGMGVLMFLSRITLFAGVKRLGGMQTALLGLGEIIVTVVLSIVFLNEHLSILQWVGAVLLLANIFLGGFDKPTPQKRYSSGVLAWLNPPQINPSDFQ
jgi:drug/metabolite transporter (DMT)-like permease